jgi:outer membrane lipoprotein-sorting protein
VLGNRPSASPPEEPALPRRLLPVVALVLCGCAAPPAKPVSRDSDPKAREIVARHLACYDVLESLELRVERKTTIGRTSHSESWAFRQKGRDVFRVDYTFPQERVFIGTASELWEYIPAAKKARRIDLARLTGSQRIEVLGSVLSRLALNGLRFAVDPAGDAQSGGPVLSLVGTSTMGGRPAYCIEANMPGDPPRGLRGWLDTERLVLLRSEFLAEGGKVVARVDAANVAEAAPGIWFPHKLTFQAMGSKGASQEITLTRVRVNEPMDDSLFTFVPPEDVEVVRQ